MPFIHTFTDSKATDPTITGGKGANLARLTVDGFPVPPGFVVGAIAYRTFAAQAQLDALSAGLCYDDLEQLSHQCTAIRAHLHAQLIPAEVAQAVRAALAGYPADQAWSVRSSSTLEDMAAAAFAGQHDTFLNICGADAVLARIRDCWLSLWGERAVLYRHQHCFAQDAAEMAVVVQQLVACQVAGVAFSINPVSGDLHELVIDANIGLGESVVAGAAPIDHWVLDASSYIVRKAHIAEKQFAILPTAGGTAEYSLDAAAAQAPCLTALQLAELGALVRQVVVRYGWPQDIEWGWDGERFWVLQARPITVIPPRWTRDESAERFPNPMTPLVWEFLRVGFAGALPRALARMGMPPIGEWFAMFDSYIYGNQNAVELVGGFRPIKSRSLPELLAELPTLRERYQWLLDLPAEWQRDLDRYLLAIGRLSSRPLDRMSVAELWAHLLEVNQVGCDYFRPNITISIAHAVLHRVLAQLVALIYGPEQAATLVGQLCAAPETRTALVNRDLHVLARLAENEPDLHASLLDEQGRLLLEQRRLNDFPTFAAQFTRFLEDYGHCELDIDYYHPTWSGQPWVVLDQISALLRGGQHTDLGAREHEQRRQQFKAEQAVLERAPHELRFFLHELIRLARVFTGLDDLEHFQTTRLNAEGHRVATELGARLHTAGLLDASDDLFFCERATLEQLIADFPAALHGDYRERIAEAKARYQQAHAQPPEWEWRPTSDRRSVVGSQVSVAAAGERLTTDNQPLATDRGRLYGIAGSPGRATGPVFRIHSPAEFARFPANAILVARTTNPAWTPLFYSAAGVIVESGGPLSHGAVTARELRLPAVMAVRDALATLHNGQIVTIDGSRGEVLIQSTV